MPLTTTYHWVLTVIIVRVNHDELIPVDLRLTNVR